jgi:predicted lipoprotein with Yx(FWY)xxD motif
MRILAAAAALAAAALAAAGGAMAAASSSGQAAPKVAAAPSRFGTILFDGRGFVLYAFTRDGSRRSVCAGACAKAWPPYIVKSRPTAGTGVTAPPIGTIRRNDGRLQATYHGRPLYYYVGDRQPRQILCQNVSEFGGLWLVMRPNGTVVR